MTKSIIIGGVPRSGKSTLASMVCKKKPEFSFIPGDTFPSTFQRVFPELNITHQDEHANICKNLDNFIFTFMDMLGNDEQVPFVLDTYHIMPEQIAARHLQDTYKIVYLGYPDLTVDEKFQQIMTYDASNSWTRSVEAEMLQKWIGGFISHSKEMKKQCDALGMTFVDVGKADLPTILKETLELLI